MANRIVLQPPHSRENVAMATAPRPPILPRTLPVTTQATGHLMLPDVILRTPNVSVTY